MPKDFEKRIESEAAATRGYGIKDMVCVDCYHRGGRADICSWYQQLKPYKVLFKHGPCIHYRKEGME